MLYFENIYLYDVGKLALGDLHFLGEFHYLKTNRDIRISDDKLLSSIFKSDFGLESRG